MTVKTVYIEITNICNLNCHTCYNCSGLNRECHEISAKQIENIIHVFYLYGLKRVLLSGGEPTLHSGFDSILELVDQYPDISFGVVTNGTIRHPKLIDVLNKKDNFTIQISLDGSNEETNTFTRGEGHFSSVIEFKNEINNPNIKPLLKMVVSQDNYNDIENYYRLAVSLGCIPEYAFIYKSGNAEENWNDKTVSAIQKIKAVKLIEKLNREFGMEAFLPLCTSRCPFADSLDNLSLCIKVDGSIQPCQSLYHEKYNIGNIFSYNENTFTKRLQSISKLAVTRTESDYNCNKCIISDGCGGGCMAAAEYLNGNPLADDGECDYRKMQFIEMNLKKNISFQTTFL